MNMAGFEQEEEFFSHGTGSIQCYDNDLQLAAELGKLLLEQNRELEHQLRQSHQVQAEQTNENQLLLKQISVLKEMNESRMRIYEEVDKNAQDMEKKTLELQNEQKIDMDRIRVLMDTLENWEKRCGDLEDKLDAVKKKQQDDSISLRRALSVPCLTGETSSHIYCFTSRDTTDIRSRNCLHKEKLQTFRDAIEKLNAKLKGEQKHRRELQGDLSDLIVEKQMLESQVQSLQDAQEKIAALESELKSMEGSTSNGKICHLCEHEEDYFVLSSASEKSDVFLKKSTSEYASSTPLKDSGNATRASNLSLNSSENNLPQMTSAFSLLEELETQYRVLLHDLSPKQKEKTSTSTCTEPDAVESDNHRDKNKKLPVLSSLAFTPAPDSLVDLRSPEDPTCGHFEKGPPEYKLLFQEIFQTLRRSVNVESDAPSHDSTVQHL